MITQAAAVTHASQPPGLFLLAWGLLASAFGLLTVTNFRGFADNFARRAEASSAQLRRPPPWRWPRSSTPAERTGRMRLIAIPFAIIGPIVTVVGLISIGQGRIGDSALGALPSPFRYVFIAFAVAAAGWPWVSRRGLFRQGARRGGWRLAVALLSSLGVLIFGIGTAMGQLGIAIAAWVIGGLPYMVLMMDDKPAGPGPGNVDD